MIDEALKALKNTHNIQASDVKYACQVKGGIYFVIYDHMQPIFYSDGKCIGLNPNSKEDSIIMREAERKIIGGETM